MEKRKTATVKKSDQKKLLTQHSNNKKSETKTLSNLQISYKKSTQRFLKANLK